MSMEDSTKIKISELTLEWLQKHPVWTWHEGHLHESEDYIVPVDLTDHPMDSHSTLIIAARFNTACGQTLDGSVSYDVGMRAVFGIELLIGDDAFGFNLGLPEMVDTDLERLRTALQDEPAAIFPISFESVIEADPESEIRGIFQFPSD